jgi:hypothetical protein
MVALPAVAKAVKLLLAAWVARTQAVLQPTVLREAV